MAEIVTTRCVECGKKRDRCRPSVKHLDGRVDHVCPQCWRALDYASFCPQRSTAAERAACVVDQETARVNG